MTAQPNAERTDPGCGGSLREGRFDENGHRVSDDPVGPAVVVSPCPLEALNGSWLIDIVTPSATGAVSPVRLRGPMRIESTGVVLRLSGDVYVAQLSPAPLTDPIVAPDALVIDDNWYPSYPADQYRWYFRSTGVTYAGGLLSFGLERQLWDTGRQRFRFRDTGSMTLACSSLAVQPPGTPAPTIQMSGTAVIGGQAQTITAYKTSPFYRGCQVEVDVMANRAWPDIAASCDGRSLTFTDVFRNAGCDFVATVNETELPETPLLTVAQMHALLAGHRKRSMQTAAWRLWLLVGSRMNGTLGLMFDTQPPSREGVVGFYDAPLPDLPVFETSARGRRLGEARLAFLRTLVHEVGHAFNLFHPKEDIHSPPVGATIMNQTGDVMRFASEANPYPCNALLDFDQHNRTSLIHSPDPQVKPGWEPFGYGHSSSFPGVADPTDALGLRSAVAQHADFDLTLELPPSAHRGEFVAGTVTLTNRGTAPRDVTRALNLAEGDAWLHVTTPTGDVADVRDVVRMCGVRHLVELMPGASISSHVQLTCTSEGTTFEQTGTYSLHAECAVGEPWDPPLRSATADIVIRPAVTDAERAVEAATVNRDVGLALAFGDTGPERDVLERLTEVMDRSSESTTGAACALVVCNSAARLSEAGDQRTGDEDAALADRAVTAACERRTPLEVARLCAAVVSPADRSPPMVKQLLDRFRGADTIDNGTAEAIRILEDLQG